MLANNLVFRVQNSAAKMSNLKLAEELHLFALDVTLR